MRLPRSARAKADGTTPTGAPIPAEAPSPPLPGPPPPGPPLPGTAATGADSPWADGLGRLAIRALQLLLILGAIAVTVAIMVRLRLLVVPILVATLIAAALSPLVEGLSRRGLPRALSTLVALLAGLGVIGGLIALVVASVRDDWDELRDQASEGFAELETFIADTFGLDAAQIEQARADAMDVLSGPEARTGAIAGATLAVEVVVGMFLGLVILFFLLKDGPRIWAFVLRPVPDHRQALMAVIGERSVVVLGGYVRGTAIIALVDAVAIGVALVILGVPLALPLAVVVFMGAFIPLIGATVAGALAALVALVTNGPLTALIVLGVVIAVNQLEGDLLAPVVLGRAMSLHPLAILLALTAGAILAGVIGALLAVPVAAVIWTAATTWNEHRPASAATPPPSAAPPGDGAPADAANADGQSAPFRTG